MTYRVCVDEKEKLIDVYTESDAARYIFMNPDRCRLGGSFLTAAKAWQFMLTQVLPGDRIGKNFQKIVLEQTKR